MEEENIVPSPQILRGIYSQFKSSGIDPAEFSPLFVSSFICILHKKLDGFQIVATSFIGEGSRQPHLIC
jgi:hypothetical protein